VLVTDVTLFFGEELDLAIDDEARGAVVAPAGPAVQP
jgi:hypothetical protein